MSLLASSALTTTLSGSLEKLTASPTLFEKRSDTLVDGFNGTFYLTGQTASSLGLFSGDVGYLLYGSEGTTSTNRAVLRDHVTIIGVIGQRLELRKVIRSSPRGSRQPNRRWLPPWPSSGSRLEDFPKL